MNRDIEKLRNDLVNISLFIFLVLGIIVHSLTTLRALRYGFSSGYLVQSLLIVCFFIITYFRKKIDIKYKITLIAITIFITLLTGMLEYGYFAAAKNYIVLLPIFVSFVLPGKKAFYFLLVTMVIFIVFGFLYSTGYLEYKFNVNEFMLQKSFWILEGVSILLGI